MSLERELRMADQQQFSDINEKAQKSESSLAKAQEDIAKLTEENTVLNNDATKINTELN